jgi:hypothetical protein
MWSTLSLPGVVAVVAIVAVAAAVVDCLPDLLVLLSVLLLP